MKPLTKIDLDIMMLGGCEDPDCKVKHELTPELYLVQQCHPGAGVSVKYDSRDRLLHLECNECEQTVTRIKPAES